MAQCIKGVPIKTLERVRQLAAPDFFGKQVFSTGGGRHSERIWIREIEIASCVCPVSLWSWSGVLNSGMRWRIQIASGYLFKQTLPS